jgi:hypothetical protein
VDCHIKHEAVTNSGFAEAPAFSDFDAMIINPSAIYPGLGIERERGGNRTGVEQQVAVNKEAGLMTSGRLPTVTPQDMQSHGSALLGRPSPIT